jgi:hypothetical protein
MLKYAQDLKPVKPQEITKIPAQPPVSVAPEPTKDPNTLMIQFLDLLEHHQDYCPITILSPENEKPVILDIGQVFWECTPDIQNHFLEEFVKLAQEHNKSLMAKITLSFYKAHKAQELAQLILPITPVHLLDEVVSSFINRGVDFNKLFPEIVAKLINSNNKQKGKYFINIIENFNNTNINPTLVTQMYLENHDQLDIQIDKFVIMYPSFDLNQVVTWVNKKLSGPLEQRDDKEIIRLCASSKLMRRYCHILPWLEKHASFAQILYYTQVSGGREVINDVLNILIKRNVVKEDNFLWHYFIQLFSLQLSKDSVLKIQNILQEHRDDEYLYHYFISSKENFSKLDKESLQRYIVDTKNVHLAILVSQIPGTNPVVLQNVVEKSGNEIDIMRFYKKTPSINYAALKKRYNDLSNKAIAATEKGETAAKVVPDRKTRIENAKKMAEHYARYNYANLMPMVYQFIDKLAEKGDWFTLNKQILLPILQSPTIRLYIDIKNKTLIDLYNEYFKKNPIVLELKHDPFEENTEGHALKAQKVPEAIVTASPNFEKYIKLVGKCIKAKTLMHNEGISGELAKAAILNNYFDLDDVTNKELLSIINSLEEDNRSGTKSRIEETINKIQQVKGDLINREQFYTNRQIILDLKEKLIKGEPVTFRKDTPEYNAIKNLRVDLTMIKDFSTIEEYLDEAKPKDPKMQELNLSLPGGWDFRVLKYLDPYAFRVGADTNCCQRIGGAGENAVIDSFINPLAGVLILKHGEILLAQSYFHWVPEQNGVILDNVEYNEKNMNKLGINREQLSKLYADYAQTLKQKMPELAYVKCGLDYNKLNNDMFEKEKMPADPRQFSVEEPYSDFDEDDHINLLKPKPNLASYQLPQIAVTTAAIRTAPRLKTSMIRIMALQLAIPQTLVTLG